MTKQYDNTNKGVLFKNRKKKTDKHPDYQGQLDVDGEEFWLSAWLAKSKDGETYMRLNVKPKEDRQEQTAPVQTPPSEEFNDDIPF